MAVKKEKPISEVVDDAVTKALENRQPAAPAPAPAAAPAAPVPAAAAPDDYEKTLDAADRNVLEIARYAEKKHPEKKGLGDQFVAFFKKVDAYLENATKAEGGADRTFDENDEDYQKFIRANRPDIDPLEWRGYEMAKIKDEAKAEAAQEAEAKFSARFEETEQRQRVLEVTPVIRGRLAQFEQNIGALALADAQNGTDTQLGSIIKVISEHGFEEALKRDPELAPIVLEEVQRGATAAAEFLALANSVKKYDAKNPDPMHTWLSAFIRRQGEIFEKDGGEHRYRMDPETGVKKTFAPRAKYNEIKTKTPEKAGDYWTFSDEDVVRLLETNTKILAENRVKKRADALAAAGYVRQPVTPAVVPNGNPAAAPATNGRPAPAAPAAPQPAGSPRATVTPSPGQAGGGNGTVTSAMNDVEMIALGLKKA